MTKILFISESLSVNKVASEVAYALMLLGGKQGVANREKMEKELAMLKDGFKLIELLELAEQFVIKDTGPGSIEYKAYHFLRRAFYVQRLWKKELGFECVEKILDFNFLKVLFRLFVARQGIKEILTEIIKNPGEIPKETREKCQIFFQSIAGATD